MNFRYPNIIFSFFVFLMMMVAMPSIAQTGDSLHTTDAQVPVQVDAQASPEVHNAEGAEGAEHAGKFNIKEVLFGHVMDSHNWHIFTFGKGHEATHASLPLPVIVYSATKGLHIFSSSNFMEHHEPVAYKGFSMNVIDGVKKKEVITADDGSKVYDFSITKNVLCMLISIALLLWIMLTVAKAAKNNGTTKAPTGIQNAVEPIVTFIRDGVAIPYLGAKYMKYLPLLLTFFFFIWINNLLGLLPLGFNLTGNIAVTALLALIFFAVMMFNSNKYFWGHIFNPPGVPFAIKLILVPIEFLSIFIKPVALALRLFANIFAGHTIIICVVSLIFIFTEKFGAGMGWGSSIISMAFTIFMFFLELLVAALQAFIFTNLAAVFIGSAIEEHHHDDNHATDKAVAH
jgi:F-type H+-transporting ATPase subunit a